MGQVREEWDRGHRVSKEKAEDGGWTQLMKGLVSPTKVSGLRGCMSPWRVLRSALHQLTPADVENDWTGWRQEAAASWEAVVVVQKRGCCWQLE